MSITRRLMISGVLALLPARAFSQHAPAAKDAYLYIIWPQNGMTIKGAFWCRFGLRNMGVTHAGDTFANSGHHHLFVDVDEPLDPSQPIPQDKKHLHFVRARPRRTSICRPASTRFSLCSATPIISPSILRSSPRRSPSRSHEREPGNPGMKWQFPRNSLSGLRSAMAIGYLAY